MSKPASFGAYAFRRHKARRAAGVVEYLTQKSPEFVEAKRLGYAMVDMGFIHEALRPFTHEIQVRINCGALAAAEQMHGEDFTQDQFVFQLYRMLEHYYLDGTLARWYQTPEFLTGEHSTAHALRMLSEYHIPTLNEQKVDPEQQS